MRADLERIGLCVAIAAVSCCLFATPVFAQLVPGDPGANVNVVGPTPDPDDIRDNGLKQQNEPSCAIRPGDADCIICGFNDYRTVDVPEIGDAWQGVGMSCDGGTTFTSRIAPGHALHPAPIGTEFAADPRMIAIPGMAIFNFIGGARDQDSGVLAIQHWLEINKEDADFYEPGKFTYIADEGTSGRFIDKPDAYFLPELANKQGTVTLSTVMENEALGTIERDFPTGKLFVAYAVITGSGNFKVLIKDSDDLGATWGNQSSKLSEDQNVVSGISLTGKGDTMLAVWRRAGDNNDFDSIMYAYSTNRGRKWTKGEVLADICSFDQLSQTSASSVTFRTNDFPWATHDGKNFYVFYSDRNFDGLGDCTGGRPRIVMRHANEPGGLPGSSILAIDDSDDGDPATTDDAGGSFQFMPAATGANGKVQVAWYDTRREGIPGGPPFVADYFDPASGGQINRRVDVYTARVISDATGGNVQISAPTRVSQFRIGARVEGPVDDPSAQTAGSVAIEGEASFGNAKLYASGSLSFIGDYIAVGAEEFRFDDNGKVVSNASPVVSPIADLTDFFIAWTSNRDVRGNIFDATTLENTVPYAPAENGGSAANDEQLEPPAPHERAEEPLLAEVGPPVDEDMRGLTRTTEGIEDPFNPMPDQCVQLDPQDRTRNANIYGSRIRDRARLVAPTPTKPLTNLQRAFPVALSNANDVPQAYRMRITNQPPDAPALGRASFRQLPAVAPFDGADVPPPTVIEDLTVPPQSTFARTVFLVSNVPTATTGVQVFEQTCVDLNPEEYYDGACPVIAQVTLGGVGPSGELQQPNYDSPICDDADPASECSEDVLAAELHNPELINPELINPELINPELINPELINPELINPELINPELINPELINLGFVNPELINPELINPELINPELINPELINPELINPELINSTVAAGEGTTWEDYTYIVQNTGNVTTSFNADIEIAGPAVDSQIIAWTLYITQTARNCDILPQVERRVLAVVNNPDDSEFGSDSLEKATISEPFNGEVSAIATPGQLLFFTRRVFGDPETLASVTPVGFTASAQSANCSQTDRPPGNTDPYFCQLSLEDERERIVIESDIEPPEFDGLNNGDVIPVDPVTATQFDQNGGIGGACVQIANNYVTASDNGASVQVTCSDKLGAQICSSPQQPGTQSIPASLPGQIGAPITCTASDLADPPNVATVNLFFDVRDTTDPFFTSFPDSPVEINADATGFGTLVLPVPIEVADQFGIDPDPQFDCTVQPGASLPVGATPVSCTVTDSSGNSFTDGYDVNVIDVTPPEFINIPLPDIQINTTTAGGVSVSYDIPDAQDSGGGTPTVSCTPPPGTVFQLGSTTVTCTADDGRGNTASASFDVVVLDGAAPIISVPTGGIDVELQSPAGSVVDYIDQVSVTDNVDPSPALSCTPASGSLFPPKSTTVNCTATDSSNNSSSASFEVRVGYFGGFGITPTKLRSKAGSSNPLTWGWKDSLGNTIDTSGDTQMLEIYEAGQGACGTGRRVLSMAGDPGSSGFRVKSDNAWEYNWQSDDGAGNPLDRGSYCARVTSELTGQSLESPKIGLR